MDPEKNSPKKIDKDKLKLGISEKIRKRVLYECDLLRMDPDRLLTIAPHIFFTEETSPIQESTRKYYNYHMGYPDGDLDEG